MEQNHLRARGRWTPPYLPHWQSSRCAGSVSYTHLDVYKRQPNAQGHIVVKGLEGDAYSLTEIATDKGYVLLKDAVKIIIKGGSCVATAASSAAYKAV